MQGGKSSRVIVVDRVRFFLVNATDGQSAAELALENAGNEVFDRPAETDPDEPMPMLEDLPLFRCQDLGSYRVAVIRRGYSYRQSTSDYASDYYVLSMEGPFPLSAHAHITDPSETYVRRRAAQEQKADLEANTPGPSLVKVGRTRL